MPRGVLMRVAVAPVGEVDPLPDETELEDWLNAFGEVEEVARLPNAEDGVPSEKGARRRATAPAPPRAGTPLGAIRARRRRGLGSFKIRLSPCTTSMRWYLSRSWRRPSGSEPARRAASPTRP